MNNKDCVFCKIGQGEAPAQVVFENDEVIAFDSMHPVAEIHILIIPKAHVQSFVDVEAEDMVVMMEAAHELIKRKNIAEGYKLVFNGGQYQQVPHLHWHLLGGKIGKEGN